LAVKTPVPGQSKARTTGSTSPYRGGRDRFGIPHFTAYPVGKKDEPVLKRMKYLNKVTQFEIDEIGNQFSYRLGKKGHE
jgi:hypothetical protein